MSSELQRNIRSLGPDLLDQLTLENVRVIAIYMESDGGLHKTELDTISRSSTGQDAVSSLLGFTRAGGDPSILSLANALRRIEKHTLADRLAPAVQQSKAAPVTTGGIIEGRAPAVSREALSENLRVASSHIIDRLSKQEVDEILIKLYSSQPICITGREKESVEAVKGAIGRASALIDILQKKDARVIQRFVDILRAVKGSELADMVQFGSTDGR